MKRRIVTPIPFIINKKIGSETEIKNWFAVNQKEFK